MYSFKRRSFQNVYPWGGAQVFLYSLGVFSWWRRAVFKDRIVVVVVVVVVVAL